MYSSNKKIADVEKTDYYTFGFFALLAVVGGCFYSDCISLIPFALYFVMFEVGLKACKRRCYYPFVWGELYYATGTVAIMWTVNNCGGGKGYFFFAPILSALIIFLIGNQFFEDNIYSGQFYLTMMVISWFCCIYKTLKAYHYLLMIQAAIMVVYLALVLVGRILSEKRYRRK